MSRHPAVTIDSLLTEAQQVLADARLRNNNNKLTPANAVLVRAQHLQDQQDQITTYSSNKASYSELSVTIHLINLYAHANKAGYYYEQIQALATKANTAAITNEDNLAGSRYALTCSYLAAESAKQAISNMNKLDESDELFMDQAQRNFSAGLTCAKNLSRASIYSLRHQQDAKQPTKSRSFEDFADILCISTLKQDGNLQPTERDKARLLANISQRYDRLDLARFALNRAITATDSETADTLRLYMAKQNLSQATVCLADPDHDSDSTSNIAKFASHVSAIYQLATAHQSRDQQSEQWQQTLNHTLKLEWITYTAHANDITACLASLEDMNKFDRFPGIADQGNQNIITRLQRKLSLYLTTFTNLFFNVEQNTKLQHISDQRIPNLLILTKTALQLSISPSINDSDDKLRLQDIARSLLTTLEQYAKRGSSEHLPEIQNHLKQIPARAEDHDVPDEGYTFVELPESSTTLSRAVSDNDLTQIIQRSLESIGQYIDFVDIENIADLDTPHKETLDHKQFVESNLSHLTIQLSGRQPPELPIELKTVFLQKLRLLCDTKKVDAGIVKLARSIIPIIKQSPVAAPAITPEPIPAVQANRWGFTHTPEVPIHNEDDEPEHKFCGVYPNWVQQFTTQNQADDIHFDPLSLRSDGTRQFSVNYLKQPNYCSQQTEAAIATGCIIITNESIHFDTELSEKVEQDAIVAVNQLLMSVCAIFDDGPADMNFSDYTIESAFPANVLNIVNTQVNKLQQQLPMLQNVTFRLTDIDTGNDITKQRQPGMLIQRQPAQIRANVDATIAHLQQQHGLNQRSRASNVPATLFNKPPRHADTGSVVVRPATSPRRD